jgi:hypothetical protein
MAFDPGGRERLAELDLTAGERLLAERLQHDKRSVDALCRELALSNFEICRSLWALKLLGVLCLCPRAAQGLEGPAAADGGLDPTSFPDLLVHFDRLRATGVLYAVSGGVERTFHIRDGRPVFATSGATEDGLVAHLFRNGMISLSDREEISRHVLSNRRVGTILCELGVLDEEDLRRMVQLQLVAIVHDTFRWESGDFAFVPGALPSDEEITIEADPARLVAEGLQRVTSWTRLLNGCGGLDHPLRLTPHHAGILERMGAGEAEWEVARAMQSPQTTRRVCRAVGLSEFQTCRILWAFRLLGAVEDAPVARLDLEAERPAEPVQLTEPEPPPGAGRPAEGPRAVEETIVRFNALHRTVYRAVRAEIGAGGR